MGVTERLVDAARDFACGLYKTQPQPLIPNPAASALRWVWDDLCDKPPPSPALPPPPTQPFTGGQCCDAVYRVQGQITPPGGSSQPFDITCRMGKVLGLKQTLNAQGTGLSTVVVSQNCAGVSYDNPVAGSAPGLTASISTVTRVSGNAANCGNPPISYPVAPPAPPNGYTSPPTAVPLGDGTSINVTFNLKPPVSLPALPLPPVIVNMIRPEFNINVPIEFNFDGTVNIGGGGSGGGGGGGDGFGQPDRDIINNINNTNTEINNEVTNINNDLRNTYNITNNKPRDPDSYLPPVGNKPPGKHEKTFLAAVEVQLTQVPANAKMQSGGTAPRVVYAGWFEFQRAGKSLPREPIHFDGGVFLAPTGVDGYAWTLYDGYQGTATEIINKEAT